MPIGVNLANLYYLGTAQLNEIFGFFQAVSTVQLTALQLSARMAPVGGNVTITLVDQNGTSWGSTITLGAATVYKNQPLAATLTLAPGSIVRAKITEVDLGVAQEFGLTLLGATAQYPVAPCCCGPCCC